MLESEIEQHLKWKVATLGGKCWKFESPGTAGVADRIVCLPDGTTHFIELKKKGGRLSVHQQLFASDMQLLNQKYACLWSKEDVDAYFT